MVDAVLCTLLVGGSRLTLRLLPEARARTRHRRRVLLVGAGRAGRSLARELRDTHEARVVGFLDDNPRVRRRRILGITVLGSLDEAARAIAGARADEVLVTIPDAPQARLDAVVRAAEEARSSLPPRPPPHGVLRARARPGDASVSIRGTSAPPPGGDSAAGRVLRPRRALRVAGVATPGADALLRRDRADLALAVALGVGRGDAPRRPVRLTHARRLLPRAGLVARVGGIGIRGGQAPARPRDDRDDLSRVRPCSHGGVSLVGARRGGGRDRGARARLLALPRGGALRVPTLDARSLAHRTPLRRTGLDASRTGRRCVLRGDADAYAALDPAHGARPRPVVDRLDLRAGATLALDVDSLGLGGRRHARDRGSRRLLGVDGSPLPELARDDRLLPGADPRARVVGARRPCDRHRGPPARGRYRRPCPPPRRSARPEDARIRGHERRGARRLHRLRRREGRVRVDRLLDDRLRAQPDLPLPGALRGDGDGVRPWRSSSLGDRRCRGLRSLRRHRRPAPPRRVPVLRRPRSRDRGVRKPRAGVARTQDRDGTARRVPDLDRRRRRALPPSARLESLRGGHRCRRGRVSSRGASRPRSTRRRASGSRRVRSPGTWRRRTTGSTRRPVAVRSSSSARRSPTRSAST